MAETYCGKSCAECAVKEEMNCPGCKAGPGRKFGGDCKLAKCVMDKGHETCVTCSFQENCATLKSRDGIAQERRRKQEADAARKALTAKQAPLLGKWLWIIFWLIIPSSIAGLMTNQTIAQYMPNLTIPGQIVNTVCCVIYGIALLKLSGVVDLYKTAGICILISGGVSAVVAAATAAAGAVQAPAWTLLLTIPSSIVALVGEYNEYTANSVALDGVDQVLSESWSKLWKWNIGLILGMIGCIVLMLIIPILGALALLAAAIGLLVIGIMKAIYLYRTAKIFREYPIDA